MNFDNKNIYIIPQEDRFFRLQADYLIERVGVNLDDIVAIYIEDVVPVDINIYPGIKYYNAKNVNLHDLKNARSITTMSLAKYNSELVARIIKTHPMIVDKLYVLITDDEVDRWEIQFEKYGKLKPENKYNIDENVLFVLSKVKYFIGFENVFKSSLEAILERQVELIDAGCMFDILSTRDQEKLDAIVDISCEGSTKKMLFHTKPVNRNRDLFKFYCFVKAFYKVYANDAHFVVFAGGIRSRLALSIINLYAMLRLSRHIKIDVVHPTDRRSYALLLMSCDYLFLQARGGCGAARALMQNGRGITCSFDKTKNVRKLTQAYNIDLIVGDTFLDIARKTKEVSINNTNMKDKFNKKKNDVIIKYKEIYS